MMAMPVFGVVSSTLRMRSCSSAHGSGMPGAVEGRVEVRQLHEVEGEVVRPNAAANRRSSKRQCLVVRHRAESRIALALIPDGPAHGVADEGMDHRVEEHARLAFGIERALGRLWLFGELSGFVGEFLSCFGNGRRPLRKLLLLYAAFALAGSNSASAFTATSTSAFVPGKVFSASRLWPGFHGFATPRGI